jgi:hypothetical protein
MSLPQLPARSVLGAAGLLVCSLSTLSGADDTAIPIPPGGGPQATPGGTRTTHSWELPSLTVVGRRDSSLRDDDIVGDYGQPRWSAVRRFSEVRTYVIPDGQAEFEYWLLVTSPSRHEIDLAKENGDPRPKPEVKQQYELEMGLGHRLQLDLYQVFVKDGSNGTNALDANKFEIRYAFADWGKLWGNPTFYGEWEQAAQGADSAEFKLLLCDDINTRWAWATNLVDEQVLGNRRDRSLEWNSAIACNAIDQVLSVGIETNFAHVSALTDVAGTTREHHWELMAGPSIRLYPIPQFHVILSEFIGLNKDAPEAKSVLIVGWEF